MSAFFVDMEWKVRDGGYFGEFHAEELVNINYEETKQKMLSSVLRLMKTKAYCTITFQWFTGFQSIDLLRIAVDGTGSMSRVFWERNKLGDVVSTSIERFLDVNMREMRKSVDMAINLSKNYASDEL